MNLVLIGYRGTGKTTLSDQLHFQLDMPVYHMDEILEERLEQKIVDYVKQSGWDCFREEERLLVEELTDLDNIIIDAGGGVIIRDDNIHDLRCNGFVVWLQAPIEAIAKRIRNDNNRPSLTGSQSHVDEIKAVITERLPRYQEAAHFIIDTEQYSFDDCAQQIIEAWKHHTPSQTMQRKS